MALVNSAFTVNVTPGAMPPTVHVSEYDIGRTYTVTINGQNGSAFNIPTGTTATVEGTLNGVIGFTTGATISGSTVSFTLTESMTAKSGKAWCKIKLTLNDEPIQTCAFVLAVDRAGVESDTVVGAPGFDEQIQDAVYDYLDENGQDAVSPQVTITSITGGHRVTITDSEHPNGQYFDVMDGEGGSGSGAVESVNGKTGAVVLGAADVGALPANTPIPAAVTERTVAGWGFTKNTGTYSKPSGGIPKSDLASDVKTSLGKADTALQTAPVTSVNNKTGAVTLTASDVGALPDGTVIPSQIGQLADNVGLVHYNSQTLTDAQKAQARTNIGAASMSDIPSLAAYRTASAQDAIDTAQDSAIAAKYTKPSGGIPASDLAQAVQTSLGKADTALQTAPVTSVNTKTGAVTLSASDVGALADDTPVLTYSSQTLTEAQKTQARANIGAIGNASANAVYDIYASFHTDSAGNYYTFTGGINASTIVAALNSGMLPIVRRNDNQYKHKWYFSEYNDDGEDVYIQFFRVVRSGVEVMLYVESEHRAYVFPAKLPSVTSSDNGKFLRVVNGAWAAQTVPSAEGASF